MLCAEGKTNKEYKWEGDTDFSDFDICSGSWKDFLGQLELVGVTGYSELKYPTGKILTMEEAHGLLNSDPTILDSYWTNA